jgi:hypothetical protein
MVGVSRWTVPTMWLISTNVVVIADFDVSKLTSPQQEMQNLLQSVQMAYRIYNSDIEPEHEYDGYCNCAIHQYQRRKINRLPVQNLWSKAVMYPGPQFLQDTH